jgi:PilZ domain
MAQEIDEGVAYLRALKRSGSSIATTAAATAREITAPGHSAPDGATADSNERFQGSEKRRSPRYKCEGSAEMREEGCDVRTWATFTDVSLHGCYVEAQATYPVGTVLHMKLETNGLRLEATGNVRVSYPYLGMGVAFVELSEANRAQLRQMLSQISRPSAITGPGIASTLPASGPLDAVPAIADPAAAMQALTEFFESRQMLMREDFLRILRKSQPTDIKG